MIIVLCILLCTAGLVMQALCEPKMLRFAKLFQYKASYHVRIGRFMSLCLAFLCSLWAAPKTAIVVWAGSFSFSVVIVAIGWAIFSRYREAFRS